MRSDPGDSSLAPQTSNNSADAAGVGLDSSDLPIAAASGLGRPGPGNGAATPQSPGIPAVARAGQSEIDGTDCPPGPPPGSAGDSSSESCAGQLDPRHPALSPVPALDLLEAARTEVFGAFCEALGVAPESVVGRLRAAKVLLDAVILAARYPS